VAANRREVMAVVVCGALVLTLSMGVRQSFGLFLEPMTHALALTPTTFALAIAVQNLLWGLAQPGFGALADRYGTRRVLVLGAGLYVAGLLVMAFGATAASLHAGAGLLVGLGVSGTSFAVVLGAVGRAVPPERRSSALGLVSAGGSLGQFLVVPVGQAAIAGLGWAGALLVLAVVAAAMAPLAWGVRAPAHEIAAGPSQSLGQAVGEAMAHKGFRLLTLGFFVCGFHVAFIATHLPMFAASCGLSPMVGATALSLIGLFNILGTWGAGVLGGRYRKKNLLAAIYFLRGVAILIFMAVPTTPTALLIFAGVMGALWLGTVPLTSGLVGQIFGPRYVATLFGLVFLGHQVGAFFGAWLGGLAYERFGDYDAMWLASLVLAFAAAAIHWLVADKPAERLLPQQAAG